MRQSSADLTHEAGRERRALTRKAGWARAVAVFSIAMGSGGCHKYVPVQVATVDPQEDVRIVVTESAAARLSQDLGLYTTSLQGRLRQEPPDSVSIAVPVTRVYQGRLVDSGRQVLFLGRSEVVRVDRRELSRTRTVAVGVGAVAVFGLIVNSVVQWLDPNPSGEEPPPPPPPAPSIRSRGSVRIPIG